MSETPIDRPEGAIPTPDDSDTTEPAPVETTMIGPDGNIVHDDEVRIDADKVANTVEAMIAEGQFGEEEPLPVGAHDPEVVAEEPVDPPGMPHQPDDLDREIAGYVQDYNDAHMWGEGARRNVGAVRPDQASVHDAEAERIFIEIKPRNVRQALLVHAQQMTTAKREAAMDYARALIAVQEMRDAYVAARDAAGGAVEALFVMGLDTEADYEPVEADGPAAPIPDSAIV